MLDRVPIQKAEVALVAKPIALKLNLCVIYNGMVSLKVFCQFPEKLNMI